MATKIPYKLPEQNPFARRADAYNFIDGLGREANKNIYVSNLKKEGVPTGFNNGDIIGRGNSKSVSLEDFYADINKNTGFDLYQNIDTDWKFVSDVARANNRYLEKERRKSIDASFKKAYPEYENAFSAFTGDNKNPLGIDIAGNDKNTFNDWFYNQGFQTIGENLNNDEVSNEQLNNILSTNYIDYLLYKNFSNSPKDYEQFIQLANIDDKVQLLYYNDELRKKALSTKAGKKLADEISKTPQGGYNFLGQKAEQWSSTQSNLHGVFGGVGNENSTIDYALYTQTKDSYIPQIKDNLSQTIIKRDREFQDNRDKQEVEEFTATMGQYYNQASPEEKRDFTKSLVDQLKQVSSHYRLMDDDHRLDDMTVAEAAKTLAKYYVREKNNPGGGMLAAEDSVVDRIKDKTNAWDVLGNIGAKITAKTAANIANTIIGIQDLIAAAGGETEEEAYDRLMDDTHKFWRDLDLNGYWGFDQANYGSAITNIFVPYGNESDIYKGGHARDSQGHYINKLLDASESGVSPNKTPSRRGEETDFFQLGTLEEGMSMAGYAMSQFLMSYATGGVAASLRGVGSLTPRLNFLNNIANSKVFTYGSLAAMNSAIGYTYGSGVAEEVYNNGKTTLDKELINRVDQAYNDIVSTDKGQEFLVSQYIQKYIDTYGKQPDLIKDPETGTAKVDLSDQDIADSVKEEIKNSLTEQFRASTGYYDKEKALKEAAFEGFATSATLEVARMSAIDSMWLKWMYAPAFRKRLTSSSKVRANKGFVSDTEPLTTKKVKIQKLNREGKIEESEVDANNYVNAVHDNPYLAATSAVVGGGLSNYMDDVFSAFSRGVAETRYDQKLNNHDYVLDNFASMSFAKALFNYESFKNGLSEASDSLDEAQTIYDGLIGALGSVFAPSISGAVSGYQTTGQLGQSGTKRAANTIGSALFPFYQEYLNTKLLNKERDDVADKINAAITESYNNVAGTNDIVGSILKMVSLGEKRQDLKELADEDALYKSLATLFNAQEQFQIDKGKLYAFLNTTNDIINNKLSEEEKASLVDTFFKENPSTMASFEGTEEEKAQFALESIQQNAKTFMEIFNRVEQSYNKYKQEYSNHPELVGKLAFLEHKIEQGEKVLREYNSPTINMTLEQQEEVANTSNKVISSMRSYISNTVQQLRQDLETAKKSKDKTQMEVLQFMLNVFNKLENAHNELTSQEMDLLKYEAANLDSDGNLDTNTEEYQELRRAARVSRSLLMYKDALNVLQNNPEISDAFDFQQGLNRVKGLPKALSVLKASAFAKEWLSSNIITLDKHKKLLKFTDGDFRAISEWFDSHPDAPKTVSIDLGKGQFIEMSYSNFLNQVKQSRKEINALRSIGREGEFEQSAIDKAEDSLHKILASSGHLDTPYIETRVKQAISGFKTSWKRNNPEAETESKEAELLQRYLDSKHAETKNIKEAEKPTDTKKKEETAAEDSSEKTDVNLGDEGIDLEEGADLEKTPPVSEEPKNEVVQIESKISIPKEGITGKMGTKEGFQGEIDEKENDDSQNLTKEEKENNAIHGNGIYGYVLNRLRRPSKREVQEEDLQNDKVAELRTLKDGWATGVLNALQPMLHLPEGLSALEYLQRVVDGELYDLINYSTSKKQAKPKVQYVRIEDDALKGSSFIVAVLPYTDGVARIHKNAFDRQENSQFDPGVIEVDGAQYLVISVPSAIKASVESQNENTGSFSNLVQLGNSQARANNSKKFIITKTDGIPVESQVLKITMGRRANRFSDEKPGTKTLSQLLDNKRSNPRRLQKENLVFGIQLENQLVFISGNTEGKKFVYLRPENQENRKGNVFLMVRQNDGRYYPLYIAPTKYNELVRDSELLKRIDALITALVSPDFKTRRDAATALSTYLYFGKNVRLEVGSPEFAKVRFVEKVDVNGETVTKPLVGSIEVNGETVQLGTVDIENTDTDNAVTQISQLFKQLNPLIQIQTPKKDRFTTEQMELYEKAGALNIETAALGNVNCSFSLQGIDEKGNSLGVQEVEVKEETPGNTETPLDDGQQKSKTFTTIYPDGEEYQINFDDNSVVKATKEKNKPTKTYKRVMDVAERNRVLAIQKASVSTTDYTFGNTSYKKLVNDISGLPDVYIKIVNGSIKTFKNKDAYLNDMEKTKKQAEEAVEKAKKRKRKQNTKKTVANMKKEKKEMYLDAPDESAPEKKPEKKSKKAAKVQKPETPAQEEPKVINNTGKSKGKKGQAVGKRSELIKEAKLLSAKPLDDKEIQEVQEWLKALGREIPPEVQSLIDNFDEVQYAHFMTLSQIEKLYDENAVKDENLTGNSAKDIIENLIRCK